MANTFYGLPLFLITLLSFEEVYDYGVIGWIFGLFFEPFGLPLTLISLTDSSLAT